MSMSTMSAAATAPAGPAITSPTMATPRPMPASLSTIPSGLSLLAADPPDRPLSNSRSLTQAQAQAQAQNGHSEAERRKATPVADGMPIKASVVSNLAKEDADTQEGEPEGRMTPLASDSGAFSRSESSTSEPRNGSPLSTAVSINSHPSQVSLGHSMPPPLAEIGLSSLKTEQKLREAALGKDRMFLLLLARDIEAFVARVAQNEHPIASIPTGTASSSVLASLGSSMMVNSATMSSNYQRMLAYKVAEWYGLKGVAGPDGSIVIGLMGALNAKTPSLRLTELAPKPPSPKQSFKIMQRDANGDNGPGGSRASSTGNEDSSRRSKTLEQREAEYALARQRIYGDMPQSDVPETAQVNNTEPGRHVVEEPDPVPRYNSSAYIPPEPVYASLVHPPKVDTNLPPAPPPAPSYEAPGGLFAYQTPTAPYPDYQQQSMHPQARMPHNGGMANYQAVPNTYMPPQYAHNGYGNINMGAYGGYGWAGGPSSGTYGAPPPQNGQMPSQPLGQMGHLSQQMTNGNGMWYGGVQAPPSQSMPMISQGVPYMGQYPNPNYQAPQQPAMFQPTPMRPGPIPHQQSSGGSSISSRSFGDLSRPHSRGSTTSTRSAASSARLGLMYPAGGVGGPMGTGMRQHSLKSTMFNPMSNLNSGARERRQNRAHSPSSTTTISSRSSRVAASIQVQPPAPGQHQLPQRPDWAANNVPYHPSPMPISGPGDIAQMPSGGGGATADFPPLHRHALNAEPMQVERAKMRDMSASRIISGTGPVWHGGANGSSAQHSPNLSYAMASPVIPSNATSISTPSDVPLPPETPQPNSLAATAIITGSENDSDFPRRVPSSKGVAALYDPSSKPALAAPSATADGGNVATDGANGNTAGGDNGTDTEGMSSEEIIEAKLAALSVRSGISIGPQPAKSGQVPSYAKIVRRE